MNILKALLKQLFGSKYERIVKSLIACLILFLTVRTAEMKVEITPYILFLTATVLSAGIMWQSLNSSGNADRMIGLFMLPFANRRMVFSLVLAFTGYTLITKTFLVLAFLFAVGEWSAWQMTVSLLCACNGCFMAAAWYTMSREAMLPKEALHPKEAMHPREVSHPREALHHGKRKLLPFVVLWCGGILLSIFFVQELMVFTFFVLASLLLSFLKLLMADAYVFYHPIPAKLLIRRTKGTGSILLYLLRYLITNKNYLLNTVGLCVIGGALPLILGQLEGLDVLPLGFAVLCLNTPICILLSCDPDLEQAVRVLPGQAGRFCIRYCFFLFSVNMLVNSVYLISWQMQYSNVSSIGILTALLLSLQSAILSVVLEWFHPLRNWKIENDLWHHPRKYIVPLIMMLIAGLISMWSVSIWILLFLVIAECFSFFFITR